MALFALQHLNFEPLLLLYATAATLNRMLQYRLYSTKFCTLSSTVLGMNSATSVVQPNACGRLFDNINGTMERFNHEVCIHPSKRQRDQLS